MANNQRCICRSHEPVDQARVNFLVIRFRDLLPLTALHHCIDNHKVKQPFRNLSDNINICITIDHFLWFQGTGRWRDIFIDSKVIEKNHTNHNEKVYEATKKSRRRPPRRRKRRGVEEMNEIRRRPCASVSDEWRMNVVRMIPSECP